MILQSAEKKMGFEKQDMKLFLSSGRTRGGPGDFFISAVVGTISSLPVFLIGTLAIQIRASLHFGSSTLGIVVAAYYLGAAVSSLPGSHLSERIGGIRVMKIGILLLIVLLVILDLAADSVAVLISIMALAGLVSGILQPALNLFLSKRITPESQGLAFGIKQAAIPLASSLGGIAVPLIALTIGWRQVFVIAAVCAVIIYLLIPKPRYNLSDSKSGVLADADIKIPRAALTILAVAIAFGMISASGLTSFLVTFAVHDHIGKGTSGWIAGIGSGLTVLVRIGVGIFADKKPRRHFITIATMLFIGAFGYIFLFLGASQSNETLIIIGTLIALGIGWGWNGLFNYSVVRSCVDAPARATGITQIGGRLGAVIGPLAVGLIIKDSSFEIAWLFCGISMVLGAVTMLIGRRLLINYGIDSDNYSAAALIASASAG